MTEATRLRTSKLLNYKITKLLNSLDQFRSRELRWMIDERFHSFDEVYCMRQAGVNLKRSFVFPAGVDIEKPGIFGRAEGVNADAADFRARRAENGAQCFFGGGLVIRADVETGKEVELHDRGLVRIANLDVGNLCYTPLLRSRIRDRNSVRVSCSSRKQPSIEEVTADECCFSTPRIIMHR